MAEVETRFELVFPSPRKLFTPAVTCILILLVTGFALINYASGWVINYFALSAGGILHGRIWQLLTYSFINADVGQMILGGMMVLFIGSAVEREWRTGSFVLLWLVVSVVCGLIWIIVSAILGRNFIGMGPASCAYGLIAVFGLLNRKKRFLALFWTVEAQHIAVGLIVIGIIAGIQRPITWIWVTGALVAYLYVKLRWRISNAAKAAPSRNYKPQSFVDID
jgi:membrane associated rhomboid family serine protease